MTDRPILFSAPMIRALLGGRKTQTRRIPKRAFAAAMDYTGDALIKRYPHQHGSGYEVGDRLWVQETYYQRGYWETAIGMTRSGKRQKWRFVAADDAIVFDAPEIFRKGRHTADPATVAWHLRHSRFMPRRFSRMTLTVTDVRVQRLQDISEEDARAEGVVMTGKVYSEEADKFGGTYRALFANLWNSLHGPAAWDANPWIVAVSFTVERRNIDQERSHD